MAITVGTLKTILEADASGMKKGVDEAKRALEQHRRNSAEAAEKLKAFYNQVGNAAKVAAQDEARAAAVAAQAYRQREKELSAAFDEIRRGQEDTGQAAAQMREQMKKALAAEVIFNQAQQISQALEGMNSAFGKGAAFAIDAGGRMAQAFFQGGPLGLALAGAGTAIAVLAENWNPVNKASQDALAAMQEGLAAARAEAAKSADALRAVRDQMDAIALSSLGGTVRGAGLELQAGRALSGIGAAERERDTAALIVQQAAGDRRGMSFAEWDTRLKTAQAGLETAEQKLQAAKNAFDLVDAQMKLNAQSERATGLRDRLGDVGQTSDRYGAAAGLSALAGVRSSVKLAGADGLGAETFRALSKEIDNTARALRGARIGEWQAIAERELRAFTEGQVRTWQAGLAAQSSSASFDARAAQFAPDVVSAEHAKVRAAMEDSTRAWRAHIDAQREAEKATRKFAESQEEAASSRSALQERLAGMSAPARAYAEAQNATTLGDENRTLEGLKGAVAANLGPKANTAISGLGNLFSGNIMEGFIELVSASSQMQAIMGMFEDIAQDVIDAFGALLEPLAPIVKVVSVLAKTILPSVAGVFKVLEPVMGLLFDVIKGVSVVIAGVVIGLEYVFKSIYNSFWSGIADLLDTLDSYIGVIPNDWAPAIRADLYDLPESMAAAIDEGTKDIRNLDYNASLKQFKENIDGTNDALNEAETNLPAAVRIARSRFLATREQEQAGYLTATERYVSASALPTTDAFTPAGSGARAYGPAAAAQAGAIHVEFSGPVYINGDPAKWEVWLRSYLRRNALLENGSGAPA